VSDKTKEILSALIDGEASEIEIHRLLRQMREDDFLIDSWVSFQETRRVLRSPSSKAEESTARLSSHQHRELNRRISAAIQEDTTLGEGTDKSGRALSSRTTEALSKPAAAFGLAASLMVAVFIGMQVNAPDGTDIANESEIAGSPAAQTSFAQTNHVSAPLTDEVSTDGKPNVDDMELRELDEEGQKRLRTYLSQHDRMARIKPNTPLVTYKKQPKK